MMYDTGSKEWREFVQYPPKNTQKVDFYLADKTFKNNAGEGFSEYYSDPENPVLSSIT